MASQQPPKPTDSAGNSYSASLGRDLILALLKQRGAYRIRHLAFYRSCQSGSKQVGGSFHVSIPFSAPRNRADVVPAVRGKKKKEKKQADERSFSKGDMRRDRSTHMMTSWERRFIRSRALWNRERRFLFFFFLLFDFVGQQKRANRCAHARRR